MCGAWPVVLWIDVLWIEDSLVTGMSVLPLSRSKKNEITDYRALTTRTAERFSAFFKCSFFSFPSSSSPQCPKWLSNYSAGKPRRDVGGLDTTGNGRVWKKQRSYCERIQGKYNI